MATDHHNDSSHLQRKPWLERYFSVHSLTSVLLALIGQAAVSIVYQIRVNDNFDRRIKTLEERDTSFEQRITELNEHGARVIRQEIALIQYRLGTTERQQAANTTNLEMLMNRVDRMDTPLAKIVSAMSIQINELRDRLAVVAGTLQNYIDILNREIRRIDERHNLIDTDRRRLGVTRPDPTAR